MSVVDHFDKVPDAGFTQDFAAETARRQLHISLALIAALALAVGVVAFALRVSTPAPQRHVAQTVVATSAGPEIAAFGSLIRP